MRTQRRQLSAALELQKQTTLQEQSRLREQVQCARAANQQVQGAKGFATAFVAQQNAMGRQLRLGDLKRRQAEEAVSSSSGAHRRREEAAFQKARAGAMRLARAEERRQGVAVLRVDMAKQLAAREVESRYELDVVRFKKQQLREIKMLLAKPRLLDGGSDDEGGEGGLSDGGGEGGGLGLFGGGHGHGGESPDRSQQHQLSSPVGLTAQPPAYPAKPTNAPTPHPPREP